MGEDQTIREQAAWLVQVHDPELNVHVQQFRELLMTDPESAIALFNETYENALDEAYTDDTTGENHRTEVRMYCRGDYPLIPTTLYNLVGKQYPSFDRTLRAKALGNILSVFDNINSQIVQINHTSRIREPLLLADIQIARPMYWPGLDRENQHLLNRFNSFGELEADLMKEDGMFDPEKVHSDFILAYSLLRSDADSDWSEAYVNAANAAFLERVLRSIIHMRFADRMEHDTDQGRYVMRPLEKTQVEKGMHRLRLLLPKSVHGVLETYKEQMDYVHPSF